MDVALLPSSVGQLPPSALENKHLSRCRSSIKPKTYRRSRNHIIRDTAKRQAQQYSLAQNTDEVCQKLGLYCKTGGSLEYIRYTYRADAAPASHPGALRPHIEQDLRNELDFHSLPQSTPKRAPVPWTCELAEGRELARSSLTLPSDRNRRPTLEREDAFRDAATAKIRSVPQPPARSEDAQVAELYRLGLLYDNDNERGAGFDLNSIDRGDAPVYSIRPAKRARKTKQARALHTPLHLDLSFTDLGGDDAIAQFLTTTAVEPSGSGQDAHLREFAPLRVIYEVDSPTPSFDVDTSQPPELITDNDNDMLSDYDCFSDCDLDDVSQREVHDDIDIDSAATPGTDAWIVLGDDS